MLIRPAEDSDRDAIWAIIGPVIAAGETYSLPRDLDRGRGLDYWFSPAHRVWVAELDGRVVGTCYLRANQQGGGAHVANCGFMTLVDVQGRGVARSLCAHALDHARALGFLAMQFNFVVSTNRRAVDLWQSMGFQVVGTLPGAFRHPVHGFVDALVMYRHL